MAKTDFPAHPKLSKELERIQCELAAHQKSQDEWVCLLLAETAKQVYLAMLDPTSPLRRAMSPEERRRAGFTNDT